MTLRLLEQNDYNLGYLELLEQLTDVGDVTIDEWNNRYNEIKYNPCIQIWVIIENNTIVASGTLILEPKFIHKNGRVAHIEDVVVDKSKHGLGIGKKLLEALVNVAKNNGCYKVILNCSNKNVGFYEKLGFTQKEIQMAHYFK
jgi:glucosamine-phosphate N-acetyltransferase